MKLTSKARYAVMAIADLALYSFLNKDTIVLKEIADRQAISISYLEQLFARLRKEGIVESVRGPGGGYRLGRPASEISVWEIIHAVDESIDINRCSGGEHCSNGAKCITHNLWHDLTQTIKSYLMEMTIGKIVRDHISDAATNNDVLDKIHAYALEKRLNINVMDKTDSMVDILNVSDDDKI